MLSVINGFFGYIGQQLLPALISVIILDVCNLTNMFGGLIIAWGNNEVDWKKFGKSVLKWILINLFIMAICFLLASISYLVGSAQIIDEQYFKLIEGAISIVEVIGVVWVTIAKYLKDIWDKLKKVLNITPEDIQNMQTTFEKYKDFKDSELGLG